MIGFIFLALCLLRIVFQLLWLQGNAELKQATSTYIQRKVNKVKKPINQIKEREKRQRQVSSDFDDIVDDIFK